ncbi:MAG: FRG domain-containing protein [Lachnospiraceae bacterium]|nr:FRG domain-containing protein [Lachnospiraceae bacterium]
MEKQIAHRFYADSLEQVLDYVDVIGDDCRKDDVFRPMWFRGQEYTYYNLEPNIFRKAEYHYNDLERYGNNHLRENYRYQHFMSRIFDKTDYREPQSVFEWQEIMQHFLSKTRLMDWSESLFTALEFALEAFLIPYRDQEITQKRHKLQPSLWILRPDELNRNVYKSFVQDDFPVIERVLWDMDKSDRKCIGEELRDHEDIYFSLAAKEDQNFNFIASLTALENVRKNYIGREKEALKGMEMNPFFYLLLRIYTDGVPVDYGTVPPLAIIHPYHSQRIKSQKGVFTVFPHYIPRKQEMELAELKIGFAPIAMEYMASCRECLYEIQLTNPRKIAAQMRRMGFKNSDLYPDTERVVRDMENMDFSI